MRRIHLPNERLIYTDIPSTPRKLAVLRYLHERGREGEIPPILVVKFPGFGLPLFEGQDHAIIDGNHRSFIAQEYGKEVAGDLIETRKDLLVLRDKLSPDHYILRHGEGIRTISKLLDVIDRYLRSILGSQPLWYSGKDE
jgi:hypothetical protein